MVVEQELCSSGASDIGSSDGQRRHRQSSRGRQGDSDLFTVGKKVIDQAHLTTLMKNDWRDTVKNFEGLDESGLFERDYLTFVLKKRYQDFATRWLYRGAVVGGVIMLSLGVIGVILGALVGMLFGLASGLLRDGLKKRRKQNAAKIQIKKIKHLMRYTEFHFATSQDPLQHLFKIFAEYQALAVLGGFCKAARQQLRLLYRFISRDDTECCLQLYIDFFFQNWRKMTRSEIGTCHSVCAVCVECCRHIGVENPPIVQRMARLLEDPLVIRLFMSVQNMQRRRIAHALQGVDCLLYTDPIEDEKLSEDNSGRNRFTDSVETTGSDNYIDYPVKSNAYTRKNSLIVNCVKENPDALAFPNFGALETETHHNRLTTSYTRESFEETLIQRFSPRASLPAVRDTPHYATEVKVDSPPVDTDQHRKSRCGSGADVRHLSAPTTILEASGSLLGQPNARNSNEANASQQTQRSGWKLEVPQVHTTDASDKKSDRRRVSNVMTEIEKPSPAGESGDVSPRSSAKVRRPSSLNRNENDPSASPTLSNALASGTRLLETESHHSMSKRLFRSFEDMVAFDRELKQQTPVDHYEMAFLDEKEIHDKNDPLWDITVNKPDVQVYKFRSENDPVVLVKAYANLRGIPVPVLVYQIRHIPTRLAWDTMFQQFKVIEKDVNGCELVYCSLKAPWPVTDRDFIQWRRTELDLEANVCKIMHRSGQHPDFPEKQNFVRAETIISGYILRPLPDDPGSTRLFILAQTDIKGFIPKWMVNPAAQRVPAQWVENLRQSALKYIKKYGTDPPLLDTF